MDIGRNQTQSKTSSGPNVIILSDEVIPNNLQSQPQIKLPPGTVPPNVPVSMPSLQRPQRRGVEIHLNRYIDENPVGTNEGEKKAHRPRRCRLSTPLGVMAQRALVEQKKSNDLLSEILLALRNH